MDHMSGSELDTIGSVDCTSDSESHRGSGKRNKS